MPKNRNSLAKQVELAIDKRMAIGESRNDAKIGGTDMQSVYSWSTRKTYIKHLRYFVKWVKDNDIVIKDLGRKPHTLEECKVYAPEWINSMLDRRLSVSTVTMCASALVKLYQCSREELGISDIIPEQHRSEIKRSRGAAVRDRNFNENLSHNKELADFCRCTGLRRAELGQIRGTDLIQENGTCYLAVTRNTKGGRHRISEIVGSDDEIKRVVELCKAAGNGKIFPKPNTKADIHRFRAEYAKRVYEKYARKKRDYYHERLIVKNNIVITSYISKDGKADVEQFSFLYTGRITKKGVPEMIKGYRDVPSSFYCRRDLKGVNYDRQALFIASRNLGHNRETVIVEHYLWT